MLLEVKEDPAVTASNGQVDIQYRNKSNVISNFQVTEAGFKFSGGANAKVIFSGMRLTDIADAVDPHDAVAFEQMTTHVAGQVPDVTGHLLTDGTRPGATAEEQLFQHGVSIGASAFTAAKPFHIRHNEGIRLELADGSKHVDMELDSASGSLSLTEGLHVPDNKLIQVGDNATATILKTSGAVPNQETLGISVYEPAGFTGDLTLIYHDTAGTSAFRVGPFGLFFTSDHPGAALNVGHNKITGVINGTDATDAATFGQLSAKEDGLGNPGTDGFVLSSTAAGVRSWIDPAAGGLKADGTAVGAIIHRQVLLQGIELPWATPGVPVLWGNEAHEHVSIKAIDDGTDVKALWRVDDGRAANSGNIKMTYAGGDNSPSDFFIDKDGWHFTSTNSTAVVESLAPVHVKNDAGLRLENTAGSHHWDFSVANTYLEFKADGVKRLRFRGDYSYIGFMSGNQENAKIYTAGGSFQFLYTGAGSMNFTHQTDNEDIIFSGRRNIFFRSPTEDYVRLSSANNTSYKRFVVEDAEGITLRTTSGANVSQTVYIKPLNPGLSIENLAQRAPTGTDKQVYINPATGELFYTT
jgi:hypothetical protein